MADRGRATKRPGVYYVAVYSAPLEDVDATVSLIRQRVLVAGALALLGALLAGYLLARAFSRRVRRMEHAARRVAQGDFGARFESGARDELGQLARTLDAMQRQLAELETARRRFIATASHELRTPIFSLSGFLELLEDEELDEETRAALPAPAAPAGRPPGQAGHRAARPLAPGGRLARAAPRADRRRRPGQDGRRRSSRRRSPPTSRTWSCG